MVVLRGMHFSFLLLLRRRKNNGTRECCWSSAYVRLTRTEQQRHVTCRECCASDASLPATSEVVFGQAKPSKRRAAVVDYLLPTYHLPDDIKTVCLNVRQTYASNNARSARTGRDGGEERTPVCRHFGAR